MPMPALLPDRVSEYKKRVVRVGFTSFCFLFSINSFPVNLLAVCNVLSASE